MITQKVPQNFKEAVDAIEKELQASSNTPVTDTVIYALFIDVEVELWFIFKVVFFNFILS